MTSSLNNCKKLILSYRHIAFALIATLPLVLSMPAHAQQNQIPTSDRGSSKVEYQGHSIDEMIYTFMAEKQIPGLSLAIVQAPYISRSVAYGISDLEQHRLASPSTVWNAGPISQGYAAVAVMQLYEQGKLDIREKVSKYVPGLPAAWADVTVFELMQHATGIADYRNQPGYDAAKNYSSQDLINSVKDIPLAFTPGTDVAQSATNFLLLANAVETASGMNYSDFVTKNQIQFLGLKHMCFSQDISKLAMENVAANNNKHKEFKTKLQFIDPTENAVGYNANLTSVPLLNSAALKGFSDIFASAADISVWDIALAGSLLIKPEHHELIYRPTKLDNGKIVPAMAGWTFFHHKGLMDSKGTTAGFSAFICRFTDPSELVCVTLLANKEGIDFTNLARRIASAYGKSMNSGANDNTLYLLESAHSVEQTVARVQAELKKRNIQLFTIIDHGQNAKDAKLEMPPSQVLVFGSDAVGTPLMKINPRFSGELPLKIAVWQDASGSVWLSFPRMKELAAGYGLENDPSIVSSLRTRAVYDEATEEWVINGTKAWITNVGIANIHVVVAAVDPELKGRGQASFVIPPNTKGLSMGQKYKKHGIKDSQTSEVVLDDVRVPARCLLGGKEKLDAKIARAREGGHSAGAQPAMKTFEATRPAVGAQALGVARAAYEYALDYAKERVAFGKPIIMNQAIAFKLANMATEIDASRLLIWRASWLGKNGGFKNAEGSMSKYKASETAVRVTEDAIQILGGYGYTREYPVERWHRDAKIHTIFEGTSEIQQLVIARAISGLRIE